MSKAIDRLRELLAELEHIQWWRWSSDIAGSEEISEERLARWMSCWRPYEDLPEEVKKQDREWADKVIRVIKKWLQEEVFKDVL